jgi:hypothetical protein
MSEDQTEELATLRAQRAELTKLLRMHVAEAVSVRHVGAQHADLFGPIVADQLDVRFDDKGRAKLVVVDHTGKARTKLVAGRFAAFEPADLVLELKQHPKLAGLFAADATPPDMRENLTAYMAWEKNRGAPALPPLTADERGRFRAANPWRRETVNLTEQMRIEKLDPKFASELKEAA